MEWHFTECRDDMTEVCAREELSKRSYHPLWRSAVVFRQVVPIYLIAARLKNEGMTWEKASFIISLAIESTLVCGEIGEEMGEIGH